MSDMLKPIMAASYYLGLVMIVIAAGLKAGAMAGIGPGFQANNWAIGACALFLCALASGRMIDAAKK